MSTLTETDTRATPSTRQKRYALPRATIREEKEGYLLQLEMPGVSKEGLELTVENHEISILGRRSESEPKGEIVYREVRPLDYRRVFELDPAVDPGRISARMENGVVSLTLPRAEKLKPRRIEVGD